MANKPFLKFNKWYGGLADSKYLGIEGSFAAGLGLDIHSKPGLLQAQQALKKDSGSTVVDLILAGLTTSNGSSYFFGDAGKIYKRTSGGTWSVLTTITNTPTILGAAEHSDGYIYFTYSNKVGRLLLSTDGVTESWNTLTNTNTNYGLVFYHEKQDQIYIGNGNLVAQVDSASAFTANALDLLSNYEVRDITLYDIDILVCATDPDNTNRSMIFQWDGLATSWDRSWVYDQAINWALNYQENIYLLTGNEGQLIRFDNGAFTDLKQIPGSYTSSAYFSSKLNSKTIYNKRLHFGLYDGSSGNPGLNGIYTFGRKNKNYPQILTTEYPISANVTTGITIGLVYSNGSTLFVAWKNGSIYGMDIIDTANKYNGYCELRMINTDRGIKKHFKRFPCSFESLAGTGISLQFKTDHASTWTTIATANISGSTNDNNVFSKRIDAYILQLRLNLFCSGNNTPAIEELTTYIDESSQR